MNFMRPATRYRQGGFTMIELMVTLAVAVILTAIALPNFRDFLRRNAVVSHANELIGDMSYARQMASTEMSIVSICASANSSSATPTCVSSNNYAQGWIIYKAPSLGTVFASAAGFSLLRAGQSMSNASIVGSTTAPVSFDQRGSANQVAPGWSGKFLICAKNPGDSIGKSLTRAPGSRMNIEPSGRISTQPLASASDDAGAQALCTQSKFE